MSHSRKKYSPTITEKLCGGLYSLFLAVFFLIALVNLLIKVAFCGAEYRHRKLQRFGFAGKSKHQGGILLHCVSVGEVVAASALVKRIRDKHPDYPIAITTTTATGADRVKQIFGDSVDHFYLPYDLRIGMQALLRKVKPKKVLITEVELWPNLIDVCYRSDIPVYIINARLTDKSANSYRKLNGLFYPMLQKITAVCAQGQRDYNNYKAMGLAEEKLILTNNMKFDQPLHKQDVAKASEIKQQLKLTQRPILLGASTHEPEEEVLINSFKQLRSEHPDLLLILTPRHPQRFAKVEKQLQEHHLNLVKLSDETAITSATEVILADKMGVLKSLYGLATIAFVGGSIANRGGHNALEAALFGKPILMGPHIHNNPTICQTLIDAGALKLISDAAALAKQADIWLKQPEQANKAGSAGIGVLQENAGAIDKTLKIIGIEI